MGITVYDETKERCDKALMHLGLRSRSFAQGGLALLDGVRVITGSDLIKPTRHNKRAPEASFP